MHNDISTSELFHAAEHLLAEGPVWSENTLYWVDIIGCAVLALPWGASSPRVYPVGEMVGAIVPWESGILLIALASGFARLDLTSGEITPLGNPEPDLPNNRLNDGKCDPQGRFVVGSMARDASPNQGSVYRLDHDLTWEKVRGPMTIPNGLAWSANKGTLYHIDSPTRRVVACTYRLNGTWTNPRVIIEIPEGAGSPDGMTIDADGNLWIALWGGWGVECWSPRTGRRVCRVDVPAAHVTCPTFGGPDLKTLFVTTARNGLSEEALQHQPHAGSIFAATPGVTGLPPVRFLGRKPSERQRRG